jgi:hypothetical protein
MLSTWCRVRRRAAAPRAHDWMTIAAASRRAAWQQCSQHGYAHNTALRTETAVHLDHRVQALCLTAGSTITTHHPVCVRYPLACPDTKGIHTCHMP